MSQLPAWRCPWSHLLTVTMALIVALGVGEDAIAQEATSPAPSGPFTLPYAPPPELCTLPARDIADYQAVIGTPEATDLPAMEISAGAPADAETVEGVTATLVQVFSCLNAGDYLRLAGAYTDAGFIEDFTHGRQSLNIESDLDKGLVTAFAD